MTTGKRPGLRSVLANAGYRRLFAAQTISRWGDTVNTVALVVLVFRLTGSGLAVSGVVIAEVVPVLLLAPLAGAVADRLPRVRIMVAADLSRTALAGLLPLADGHVAAVYAIAFGLSAAAVFFNPASAAVLPCIVDERELVAANSGLWSAAVVSQIALAPLGGALVAAWGAPAFYFNAATFAVSALTLAGLRLARTPAPVTSGSWTRRISDGIRLLARDRLLRLLALVQLLAALSAGATSALLVVFAERRLSARAASGCCSAPSASVRPSGRCCWPTSRPTPAGWRWWPAPTCCAALSTLPSPQPAACPWPRPRSPFTAWAPPPAWSPATRCCKPRSPTTPEDGSSPDST